MIHLSFELFSIIIISNSREQKENISCVKRFNFNLEIKFENVILVKLWFCVISLLWFSAISVKIGHVLTQQKVNGKGFLITNKWKKAIHKLSSFF